MVDAVFNALLTGSSGYALATVGPTENPCLFTACAIGLCHGVIGLYANMAEGTSNTKEEEAPTVSTSSNIHDITSSCVDIVALPLINIDFYRLSQQTSYLALGHGVFVIPLAFDLAFKLFDTAGDGETTEVLKELSALGNMISLLFLAINENQLPLGLMALAAFYAEYAPVYMETILRGSGTNLGLLGWSTFFSMIPWALEGFTGQVGE